MDWRNLPPLSALRAFAALAQTGSATAAGQALNVSHAAISQQIRNLESHLGDALVNREGRNLRLTPAGAELASDLAQAFALMETATARFSQTDASRPLHITMTPAFAVGWLMPRIADFTHRHPDIELLLNPTPEVVTLGPGGCDLALRFGTGPWPGLDSEPLLVTNMVIVAARSLVGDTPPAKPADLLNYPWLQELGTNELSTWLGTQGVLPPEKMRVTNMPGFMILDALRRGDGISATVHAFVAQDIADGTLVLLHEDIRPGSGYHMVTRPGVQRPALKTFLAWLRRQRAS